MGAEDRRCPKIPPCTLALFWVTKRQKKKRDYNKKIPIIRESSTSKAIIIMSSMTDMQRQLNVVRFLSVCEEFLQRDTTSSSSSTSNKGNVIIVTQLLLAEALATEQSLKKNPSGNSHLSQISAMCNQLKEALLREKAAVAAAAILAQQEDTVPSTLGKIERVAPLETIATKQGKTTMPGDVCTVVFDTANEDNDNNNDTTSAARITQLLQQQKDISTQEIEEERKIQSVLTTELAEMTR